MTITDLIPSRPRPLVAAALNFSDGVVSPELLRQLRRHQAWQQDASAYFSEIGEIHYIVNRAASALSEATLYCATKPLEGDGEAVPVDAPESRVTPAVAAAAQEVLAELRSPVGGLAQLIHQAYVNAEIPGEFYLIDDEDRATGESAWWVRSVLETTIREVGDPVMVKGVGEVPYDNVSRVWRPHPMRFEAADSGMRPVLGQCELVVLIDRQFRASVRSRLFAGLLLMPSGLREGQPDTAQKGDAKADSFVEKFIDALNTAIGEEGAASAVTPNMLWGNRDDLKEVRRVEFAQQVDPEMRALRGDSITRIVQGLEYPSGILMTDANHWNMWFQGDSFIDHIRPKGNFLSDAFSTVQLRPGLESRGFDPAIAAEVFYAFDYSPLSRKPNIVETATMAHDRYVISDASLRRDLGYDDDDAPDEEEVAARVARRPARGDTGGVTTGPPAGGPDTVAASALPDDLGGQLARIDWDLTERLFGATVAAVRRAAERAGNRAKSRVASAHRDAVRDTPAGDVCAQLGPTLLAAAGLTDDELLADGFQGLEKDYRRWADAAAEDAYAKATEGADVPDGARASWEASKRANVDASWAWLAAGLSAVLSRRIAEGGDPSDSEIRALIRQALAAAGGVAEFAAAEALATGRATLRVPVSAVTGIGTGPLTLDMLAVAGREVAGWRWVHDSPEHPFPPHAALNGAEATTIDEFGIGFGDWPGSHAGCLCTLVPMVRRNDD